MGGFMSLCVCVHVREEWGKFNSSHIPRLPWGVMACNNVCSRSSYPCVPVEVLVTRIKMSINVLLRANQGIKT